MNKWLTKERKLILVVGGMLLIGGLVLRFSPLVKDLFSANAEIRQKNLKIAKALQVIEHRQAYEKQAKQLERALSDVQTSLLTGKTNALAAYDLQKIVKEIVEARGTSIKTTLVLKSKKLELQAYTAVYVKFTLTATIRQIKEILYRIEQTPKLLIIDNLRLTASRNDPFVVDAEITVQGISRSGDVS